MAMRRKGGWAGLDIRNASNGAPPHYRTLHLELQPRPMSREHARPQSPAGSRRYGEGAKGQRSQPRCQWGSPATEPSGPGAKLDPPDHAHPRLAPPWRPRAQRVPDGVKFRPLASLIAQLLAAGQRRAGRRAQAAGAPPPLFLAGSGRSGEYSAQRGVVRGAWSSQLAARRPTAPSPSETADIRQSSSFIHLTCPYSL
jgi:hypothetical protein